MRTVSGESSCAITPETVAKGLLCRPPSPLDGASRAESYPFHSCITLQVGASILQREDSLLHHARLAKPSALSLILQKHNMRPRLPACLSSPGTLVER